MRGMTLLAAAACVMAHAAAGVWASATRPQAPAPVPLDAYLRAPEDNQPTPARVALGRRLFFDPRLSGDSVACATCHRPDRAFADDRAVAIGVAGRAGTRNAPSLVNRGFGESFFWDGRAASLEAQVLQPIANHVEMGATVAAAVARVGADAGYRAAFRAAYGRDVDADDLARALASYVRSVQSGDAPVDRFLAGDRTALSAEARAGMRVFQGKGLCTTCHPGTTFSDERFHNTGIAWDGAGFRDRGRAAVTGLDADAGAFKTPMLRDVARTAPYMHDGSLPTLDAVVSYYDAGGRPNPHLDREIVPLHLTAGERAALVAFLEALSGTISEGTAR